MDIITGMADARAGIIKYCSGILDGDSLVWVKGLLSDINKKCMTSNNDDFVARVWPLYKNFVRFHSEHCDEVTPGALLTTLYISALELGVRKIGDRVEGLKEFTDEVDMEDWDQMSVEYALRFDIRTELMLIARLTSYDCSDLVWAGGLRVMSMLDFI